MVVEQIKASNTISNIEAPDSGGLKKTEFGAFATMLAEQLGSYCPLQCKETGNVKVSFKVGECKLTRTNWEKDDFPFWEYFDKNTTANKLNGWHGSASGLSQTEIQDRLKKICFGEMVVIIPESLKEKMQKDPSYADAIYKKIAKWKENYDLADNVIAAQNGFDADIYQMTKSYCITLDENGNVDKNVVISGGVDCCGNSNSNEQTSNSDPIKYKLSSFKKIPEENIEKNSNNGMNQQNEIEYMYLDAMGILASGLYRKL